MHWHHYNFSTCTKWKEAKSLKETLFLSNNISGRSCRKQVVVRMLCNTYTYKHALLYTYLKYIHTYTAYIHTCTLVYILKVHTYIQRIHTCTHVYILKVHTYIQRIHTCTTYIPKIHTYIHVQCGSCRQPRRGTQYINIMYRD